MNKSPSELTSVPDSSDESFTREFARRQRLLFAYLMTLLADPNQAEEVLQETCAVIWRKRAEFEPGTNFVAWATTIAHNQARAFRRQCKRQHTTLPSQLLDQIAEESVDNVSLQEARSRALTTCLESLPEKDRELIQYVYSRNAKAKAAAKALGRSIHTVYKALRRIRRSLHDCIERRLVQEGME